MPYFVCGLIVKDGIVVEAAPIMRWAEGKHINFVKKWVQGKGGLTSSGNVVI